MSWVEACGWTNGDVYTQNVLLSCSNVCFLRIPSFTSILDITRHSNEQDQQITAFCFAAFCLLFPALEITVTHEQ